MEWAQVYHTGFVKPDDPDAKILAAEALRGVGGLVVDTHGNNFAAQPYHVAITAPVVHCCMGGLEID